MKRYYRSRFILGAMVAFLILLLLAVSGIWVFSYQQMERENNEFLEAMQNSSRDETPQAIQDAPPPMFGYTPGQRNYPAGFYDIAIAEDNTIQDVRKRGISEEAEISVQQYVQQAVAEKKTTGKIGSYKYSIAYQEDGTGRIILLDISIQLQALYHILTSSVFVGIILTVVLFLILIPVSGKVAEASVRNIEKQKQFITDAGHDLKTPVAIIRSNLEVMELLQGKSKWSENIQYQVSHLEHLIGQLVLMARLEETGEKVKQETINLSDLIRNEVSEYTPSMQQKEIACKLECQDGLVTLGNEKAIRQMLDLLLDNAVQYTLEGGTVLISAAAERKKIHLVFFNSVDQLPEVSPRELTDRFVRGNTARTQESGGSGIGLSSVRRIVEMHKGKIEISYQGEHGFQVSVLFPMS